MGIFFYEYPRLGTELTRNVSMVVEGEKRQGSAPLLHN